MTYGIVGFGAYVPRLRLERGAIATAHKWMNPSLRSAAKGSRAFCSWDEDALTMAVEAARDCLAGHDRGFVGSVRLASTTLPYADLSSGSILASALDLPVGVAVENSGGSQRAATSALLAALKGGVDGALVVAGERPVALPASIAEIQGGAGAAALLLGSGDPIARLVGSATRTAHFVDHFRAAGEAADYQWEERWIRDEGYMRLVPDAVVAALADAGVAIADVTHLVLASPLRGIAKTLAGRIGFTGELADPLDGEVGYCGAAHPLMMLADTLSRAKPGERIVLIGFGQGVDVLLIEATEAIARPQAGRGMTGAVADALVTQDYLRMLSFYDGIALDWGMRGEKVGKAALTEHYRSSGQLDSFNAGTCSTCGTVQFPVLAYCVNPGCGAPAAGFERRSLADHTAKIFTVTSDWLSYHPAPPLAVGFVQFDFGARLLMEVVDARPDQIVEGQELRMVFRIKERDRARGYNRYFWKATPTAAAGETNNG